MNSPLSTLRGCNQPLGARSWKTVGSEPPPGN
jgi:hypothetical protein